MAKLSGLGLQEAYQYGAYPAAYDPAAVDARIEYLEIEIAEHRLTIDWVDYAEQELIEAACRQRDATWSYSRWHRFLHGANAAHESRSRGRSREAPSAPRRSSGSRRSRAGSRAAPDDPDESDSPLGPGRGRRGLKLLAHVLADGDLPDAYLRRAS